MLTDAEKKLRNNLGYSWFTKVGKFLVSQEMKEVAKRVNKRRKGFGIDVYPSREDTFKAFRLTAFEDVKVVILGQDPYHTKDIADGLAFSSQDPFSTPPSLANIAKEIEDTIYGGLNIVFDSDLSRWAIQGVLLLNTILTVEKGKALSHEKFGWQHFTNEVIKQLIEDEEPKVFMLWGMAAKATYKEVMKTVSKTGEHLVLDAAHPAAEAYTEESAGFFGCNHFKKANDFLKEKQFTEILW